MQMRCQTHHVFGVRQLENALRAARAGQRAREPGATATTMYQPHASHRGRSGSGCVAEGGTSGAAARPRPQTAPFRVAARLNWELASAGGRAVRSRGCLRACIQPALLDMAV
jgi:hypothetical protein